MSRVAWSYSVLDSFETCPRRHYLIKISKQVVEKPSDAMQWGNRVHQALDKRLTGHTPLPETLKEYEPLAASVIARAKGGKLVSEQQMAMTANFGATSWFAKDVWVRAITDFTIFKGDKAFIGDWKTGRPTPASAQLKLTAGITMQLNPKIEKVVSAFVWLKDGTTTNETYTREDLPDIWQHFAPRVQRLEQAAQDNNYPPRPSGLCRAWCPVGKRLCEHCGE